MFSLKTINLKVKIFVLSILPLILGHKGENPIPADDRIKILHMKGTDQEKIRKFIFKEFPEVYAYHENPRNPAGWSDCFLQRKTWS